jgi:hypothetical protein
MKRFLLPTISFLLSTQLSFGFEFKTCSYKGVSARCIKDLSYGEDERQKLDVWFPRATNKKIPMVVYIHGGGYHSGDKSMAYKSGVMRPDFILKMGMAFATINYRLSENNAYRKSPKNKYPAAMADSARAIQFLRYNAVSFGVDKNKLALSGTSAGGHISLWLSLHDDLAKTRASDLRRESTKSSCTIMLDAQATLNIPELIDLLGPSGWELAKGAPGVYGLTQEQYLAKPKYWDRVLKSSYEEASAIAHLSPDDNARVLMSYMMGYGLGDSHSPEHGAYLTYGLPHELKNHYNRLSLEELGLKSRLLVQKPQSVVKRAIKSHLNACFR